MRLGLGFVCGMLAGIALPAVLDAAGLDLSPQLGEPLAVLRRRSPPERTRHDPPA